MILVQHFIVHPTVVKEENTKLAEDIDTLRRDNQQLKEALNDANIWSKGLRELVEKLQVICFCHHSQAIADTWSLLSFLKENGHN